MYSNQRFRQAQYTLVVGAHSRETLVPSPDRPLPSTAPGSNEVDATSLSLISTSNAPALLANMTDFTISAPPAQTHAAISAKGGAACRWDDGTCQACGSVITKAAFSRHKMNSCRFRVWKRKFQCHGCFKLYGRLDALKRHCKATACLDRYLQRASTPLSSGPGGDPRTIVPQNPQGSSSSGSSPNLILHAPVTAQSTSIDSPTSHGHIQRQLPSPLYDNHSDNRSILYDNRNNNNMRRGTQCNYAAHQPTKYGVQHSPVTQASRSQPEADQQESIGEAFLSTIITQDFQDLMCERPKSGSSVHAPSGQNLLHAHQFVSEPLESQTAPTHDPGPDGHTLEACIGSDAGFTATDFWTMLCASFEDPSPEGFA